MTNLTFDTNKLAGNAGPVTCSSCGCRLERHDEGSRAWFHFAPIGGRDARGCLVRCADQAHDARGNAAA